MCIRDRAHITTTGVSLASRRASCSRRPSGMCRARGACPERHSPGSRTSTSTAPSSSMARARFTRIDRGSASGSRWSRRETMPGTSVSFRSRVPPYPPGYSDGYARPVTLDPLWLRATVSRALDEDLGADPGRDVTTQATVSRDSRGTAHLVARASGVVAGLVVVPEVVAQVADRFGLPPVHVDTKVDDGAAVQPGTVLAVLSGPVQVLLIAERTLLNLVSRASGVATHTRLWADALSGTHAQVLDTRKTSPGLRALEKYAVRCGGGTNKRMGLYDVAMIKDNHKLAAGSVSAAFDAVHGAYPAVDIQVEVTTAAEALEAVSAGARFLLCDNMSVNQLRAAVEAVRGTGEEVQIEATGGLTLAVARAYAETGVDFLSVGALTHSSPILDIALDLVDDET